MPATPRRKPADEVAHDILPYDGTHTADQVLYAADLIATLMRTIANATNDVQVFGQPDEVSVFLGRLYAGLDRLPLIAHNAATSVIVMAGQPGLRLDQLARPADDPLAHGDPQRAAMTAATVLAEHVSPAVGQLATVLRAATHNLSALAIDYGDEPAS